MFFWSPTCLADVGNTALTPYDYTDNSVDCNICWLRQYLDAV